MDARTKNDCARSGFPLFTCEHIGYTAEMAGKDSGFRIRVERDLREKFIELCRAQDRPAAQVIRDFMRQYIAAHEANAVPDRAENEVEPNDAK